ncbi:MAG: polysaccharide deacetylase family protein [Desulfobaccales bacterium]
MNKELELTQEELIYLINYYKYNKYNIISLDEVHDILIKGKNCQKFVSFTFDDGYRDNFTYAYPIFKKYGLPFAINLTTGFPDNKVILWWYILEDLLLQQNQIMLNINDKERNFKCSTPLEKYDLFNILKNYILDSNQYEYFNKLDKIFKPYGIDLFVKTDKLALNWDQINMLSDDPLVTIGAHTACHKPFNKLTEEKIRNEIIECVSRIEIMTGNNVEHFSYPFGQCGSNSCNIVKQMGFKTATTTMFSNIFKEHKNYFEQLPRIYGIDEMPLIPYLNIFTSGTYTAVANKFLRCFNYIN